MAARFGTANETAVETAPAWLGAATAAARAINAAWPSDISEAAAATAGASSGEALLMEEMTSGAAALCLSTTARTTVTATAWRSFSGALVTMSAALAGISGTGTRKMVFLISRTCEEVKALADTTAKVPTATSTAACLINVFIVIKLNEFCIRSFLSLFSSFTGKSNFPSTLSFEQDLFQ
jgi:hypothetical protein